MKLAVTQANQINPDRPLHQEAQTEMARWESQLQLIKPSPSLESAQTTPTATSNMPPRRQ